MPEYIRGVINLRGKIIPVMDLRLRFGFPHITNTEQTCIVVVQVKLPDGKATPMGMVVDGVEEVINFSAADIEKTPDFGGQIAVDYILGMAKVKGVVKVLLDIDRVVGAAASQDLQAPLATAAGGIPQTHLNFMKQPTNKYNFRPLWSLVAIVAAVAPCGLTQAWSAETNSPFRRTGERERTGRTDGRTSFAAIAGRQ